MGRIKNICLLTNMPGETHGKLRKPRTNALRMFTNPAMCWRRTRIFICACGKTGWEKRWICRGLRLAKRAETKIVK